MPLSCDCYPGCWGAHSKDWPLVINPYLTKADVRKIVMSVVPYGCYVTVEEGTKVENSHYLQLVHTRIMESAYGQSAPPDEMLVDLEEKLPQSIRDWGSRDWGSRPEVGS